MVYYRSILIREKEVTIFILQTLTDTSVERNIEVELFYHEG